MTFADLKTETSRRLAEYGGRVFYTDQDIAIALNEGYMELSDASEWREEYLEINLLNDHPWYDLRHLVGPRLLGIGPAFNEGTNRWLIPTTVRALDAHDRRWERVTGTPQRVMVQGLWWVGYWPRVQADTVDLTSQIGASQYAGVIKQFFTALPEPLLEDDDEPGFPETWHLVTVDFALTTLWAQDGETTRALAAWQAYLAGETGLTQWVDRRAVDARQMGVGSLVGDTAGNMPT